MSGEQLPNIPTNFEATSVSADEKAECPSCKRSVTVFRQKYNTVPQDDSNMIREYSDTFCASCGTCIEHTWVDRQA